MKKILFVAGCLAAFQLSSVSFADEAHPCKSLEEACKSAGFYKGGTASHKGLFKDCVMIFQSLIFLSLCHICLKIAQGLQIL